MGGDHRRDRSPGARDHEWTAHRSRALVLGLLKRLAIPRLSELGRSGAMTSSIARSIQRRSGLAVFLYIRPNALVLRQRDSVLGDIAQRARATGVAKIVLSLEETDDFDSSTLEAFSEFREALAAQGRTLFLARVHDRVRDVLERGGLAELAEKSTFSVDEAVRWRQRQRKRIRSLRLSVSAARPKGAKSWPTIAIRFCLRFPSIRFEPTQITIGQIEVEEKRKADGTSSVARRRNILVEHMMPVVIGPKGCPYVIDHHHLARALHDEGQKKVLIQPVANLTKPVAGSISGDSWIIRAGFIRLTSMGSANPIRQSRRG